VRSADALADPAVLDRARAFLCDALLVQLVVEEGAVVGDENEAGNAVMCCGPERGRSHQEIAIAHDRDRKPAAVFQRKRRAHGDTRAGTHAAAALRPDVIERMAEVAVSAVPAER